jgi:hypothetical protein
MPGTHLVRGGGLTRTSAAIHECGLHSWRLCAVSCCYVTGACVLRPVRPLSGCTALTGPKFLFDEDGSPSPPPPMQEQFAEQAAQLPQQEDVAGEPVELPGMRQFNTAAELLTSCPTAPRAVRLLAGGSTVCGLLKLVHEQQMTQGSWRSWFEAPPHLQAPSSCLTRIPCRRQRRARTAT